MNTLEHVVNEALGPELTQALVMIYCRHLGDPASRRTLYALATGQAELARQFAALDELHDRHPFPALGRTALLAELGLLYRHEALADGVKGCRQLRALGQHELDVLAAFDAQG